MEVSADNVDFSENIIIIESVESDNVASGSKPSRSVRRTDLQLQKLKSFMTKNPDFTQGKPDERLLLAWDNLTAQLNSIGPPIHSSIAWRKIWSDYKANQKRKRSPGEINLNNENDDEYADISEGNKLSKDLILQKSAREKSFQHVNSILCQSAQTTKTKTLYIRFTTES